MAKKMFRMQQPGLQNSQPRVQIEDAVRVSVVRCAFGASLCSLSAVVVGKPYDNAVSYDGKCDSASLRLFGRCDRVSGKRNHVIEHETAGPKT